MIILVTLLTKNQGMLDDFYNTTRVQGSGHILTVAD